MNPSFAADPNGFRLHIILQFKQLNAVESTLYITHIKSMTNYRLRLSIEYFDVIGNFVYHIDNRAVKRSLIVIIHAFV